MTYDDLALRTCTTDDRILVDDGLLELVVLAVHGRQGPRARRARRVLKSHKGMNLPGVQVSAPSITDKDRDDIAFAVEQGLDYLALSFVRRAEDIARAAQAHPARRCSSSPRSRRTRRSTNIESIVRASDGVMVARGDLGVELPFEEVPFAQKRIIAVANKLGPPRDHGHADARVDDRRTRVRRAPKRATSPTPSSTAPTP